MYSIKMFFIQGMHLGRVRQLGEPDPAPLAAGERRRRAPLVAGVGQQRAGGGEAAARNGMQVRKVHVWPENQESYEIIHFFQDAAEGLPRAACERRRLLRRRVGGTLDCSIHTYNLISQLSEHN